jgi:hypothetical protein
MTAVGKHLEVSEQTWHRWRNQYGGMRAEDAARLKKLQNPARQWAAAMLNGRARAGHIAQDPGSDRMLVRLRAVQSTAACARLSK